MNWMEKTVLLVPVKSILPILSSMVMYLTLMKAKVTMKLSCSLLHILWNIPIAHGQ